MSSPKKEDQKKAPEKTSREEELSRAELEKVTGGSRRSKTGDPCDGGEIA
jgi:hypothetical protein